MIDVLGEGKGESRIVLRTSFWASSGVMRGDKEVFFIKHKEFVSCEVPEDLQEEIAS